jgi:hypothetical protein
MSQPDLFLTKDELVDLTGRKKAVLQVEWLKKHRWLYETNACGAPRVARAYFERRMVGDAATPVPGPVARHNLGAHLRAVK